MTTVYAVLTSASNCKLCSRNAGGTKCKKHHREHMAALRAAADVVIATGKCPCCGTGLVRNLALTGWWQCGAYASEDFRRPEFRGLPSCSFQVFGS